MIINYTNKNNEYIAKYIQEITGDEIYDANSKIKAGDTSPLFSERPYVLIADYNMLCKARTIFTMGRTEFSGSKIVYVIFTDDNGNKNKKNFLAFAKSICAVKNTVLFGCADFDNLKDGMLPSETQIVKAKSLALSIRDFVPFLSEVNASYPLRCAVSGDNK